ncbi:hypothetical protein Moror_2745 [Moniliophthora roreri MCA 2997]|uniref:GPI anchored protein n=2 Tax=Moniliophthora roreri TaxID=221103 RepID=V2WX13_MONRO|nr:hypothetical protein Moror_2745 [Moniliophthora roreri MCA 2997]KAI3603502.1 hypothetical protein WG66_014259 [Moniliophthora roreri]
MHRKVTLLVLVAAGLQAANAQTSLYLPGWEEQAISADILGVDDKGRTTWQIQRGASTAADDDESGFHGTFTLVEGSDYVSYTVNDPQLSVSFGYDCSLSGDIAVCSGVVEGETFTATETVSRFLVQGGTTAAGVTPTAGGGASAPTTSPTGAQTSGGSASSPTNTSNAASSVKLASSGVIVGAVGFLLSIL